MKRAKKRPLPSLAERIAGAKRTARSLKKALAFRVALQKWSATKRKRVAVNALRKLMNGSPPSIDDVEQWIQEKLAYDPVLRAAKDPGQRKFDEDVKAGRASNTSGIMFSDAFMRKVKVDTGKDVL